MAEIDTKTIKNYPTRLTDGKFIKNVEYLTAVLYQKSPDKSIINTQKRISLRISISEYHSSAIIEVLDGFDWKQLISINMDMEGQKELTTSIISKYKTELLNLLEEIL